MLYGAGVAFVEGFNGGSELNDHGIAPAVYDHVWARWGWFTNCVIIYVEYFIVCYIGVFDIAMVHMLNGGKQLTSLLFCVMLTA